MSIITKYVIFVKKLFLPLVNIVVSGVMCEKYSNLLYADTSYLRTHSSKLITKKNKKKKTHKKKPKLA